VPESRLASRGTHLLLMLLAAGGAMEAGFFEMLVIGPRPGSPGRFLALYLATFACYAFAVRLVLRPGLLPGRVEGTAGTAILVLACLFRATLLGGTPALSGDLYRYRWDGRLLLAGVNPYLEPPDAPSLLPLRDDSYARMEHTEVRTIYPPAAQALFAAGAALAPGVTGIKGLLVLADLLAIAVLRRILARRGVPPLRILLYAWNPLAVIEVAWSGHLEPAGVVCVLLAAGAIIQERPARAVLALTLAGLVKVLPFALFAPLWRRLPWRALLAVPILVAAAFWPFRSAGRRLWGGLETYAGNWSGNEAAFRLAREALAWLHPTPALKSALSFVRAHLPGGAPLDRLYPYLYPDDLARAACALAAAVFAVVLARRSRDPLHGLYLMTGALLLLSPTLHPWYLLWLLPWLCLFPSRAWILLSGLVVLAYAGPGTGERAAEPPAWVAWLEYGPFYLILVLEFLRTRARGSGHGPVATLSSG